MRNGARGGLAPQPGQTAPPNNFGESQGRERARPAIEGQQTRSANAPARRLRGLKHEFARPAIEGQRKESIFTMPGPNLKSERMGAIFLLGMVLFNPPLLKVFDTGAETTVFGVPVLFLYFFLAWAVLIFLMARVIDPIPLRKPRKERKPRRSNSVPKQT
mgnify:CR=1 FL=1